MHVKILTYIKQKILIFSSLLSALILIIFCLPIFYSNAENVPKNFEEKKLPIIMYHLVFKNPGQKNRFTVSTQDFENDLKYIKKHGYTTIFVNDLIAYTEGKMQLPEKPILLTFDDGAYNNYLYAFPLAKKYNMKFVFSPIVHETERYTKIKDENPSYAHANWDKIKEMSDSGFVEIQNHTYNMHSSKYPRIGCTKKKNESKAHYKEVLSKDLSTSQDLIEKHIGKRPLGFFYPFGAKSNCSEEIIKSLGFKATFICESKINKISKNPDCLFEMGRFLRPPNISSEKFFSLLEK